MLTSVLPGVLQVSKIRIPSNSSVDSPAKVFAAVAKTSLRLNCALAKLTNKFSVSSEKSEIAIGRGMSVAISELRVKCFEIREVGISEIELPSLIPNCTVPFSVVADNPSR